MIGAHRDHANSPWSRRHRDRAGGPRTGTGPPGSSRVCSRRATEPSSGDRERRRTEREEAVRRTSGALTGRYGPRYLRRLRGTGRRDRARRLRPDRPPGCHRSSSRPGERPAAGGGELDLRRQPDHPGGGPDRASSRRAAGAGRRRSAPTRP